MIRIVLFSVLLGVCLGSDDGETVWSQANNYDSLDNSVRDYVGAQFHHDIENDVSQIVQQWHQAGGTTNPMEVDNDSENQNDNDENEWTSFDMSNNHDSNIRSDAKGMLKREVENAIRSASHPDQSFHSRDHFGSEPNKWLRQSSDAFEEKAHKLRDQTDEMKRNMEKDKWVSRKWNADYGHDKVLEHNEQYLSKHPSIKSIKHETQMKPPTFKLPKRRHRHLHRIRHIHSETHEEDVQKILGQKPARENADSLQTNPEPKMSISQLKKLDGEIGKQTGWLKKADNLLDGKVKVVKGEISTLKDEVKHLATAITSKSQDDRRRLMTAVDRNLRKIAESVIHMRAAEKEREQSRRAFEAAAESAKHRLQMAKKSVEGVLHRSPHHSHSHK